MKTLKELKLFIIFCLTQPFSALGSAMTNFALMIWLENETALGMVNTCTGVATLAGSIITTFVPAPKSRVKVICNCLLNSMSTENFLLAFGRSPIVWCIGEKYLTVFHNPYRIFAGRGTGR